MSVLNAHFWFGFFGSGKCGRSQQDQGKRGVFPLPPLKRGRNPNFENSKKGS